MIIKFVVWKLVVIFMGRQAGKRAIVLGSSSSSGV